LNKVAEYLERAAKSINEEKIRDKVNEAIAKMKTAAADFDFEETKATVTAKVDDLSNEIYNGLKDGLRNVKAEFDGLKYEHLNADSLKEYINKVVNSPLIKPYLGAEKKRQESEEIAERSRLKNPGYAGSRQDHQRGSRAFTERHSQRIILTAKPRTKLWQDDGRDVAQSG
ncbi:MAG: hypothetical protein LRZ88_09855, partial [Candidatus Cloacimonetes bacterium]|nr:hypothetical protein [Candidatus Cloacimonadota bacterium]